MLCTRCDGTGFLNIQQVDEETMREYETKADPEVILRWINRQKVLSDVQVCDCCGDGEWWHGEPGEHATSRADCY